jgi:hypothetical protein
LLSDSAMFLGQVLRERPVMPMSGRVCKHAV